MRVWRVVLASALVATAVSFAGAAEAAEERAVLVLPIEHDDLDLNLVKNLTRLARERVQKVFSRYKLMPEPALSVSDLIVAAGCNSPTRACLAALGKTVGARRVVRIALSGPPEKIALKVVVVKTRKDRGRRDYTATVEDLGPDAYPIFAWHIEKGVGGKPKSLDGRIVLLTEGGFGSLEGADLLLDDAKIDAAKLEKLRPGRYRLEVKQEGFETFIWLGEVARGRTETVRVKFVPKKDLPPSPPIGTAPPPPLESPKVIGVRPEEESDGLVFTWVLGSAAIATGVTAGVFTILVETLETRTERDNLDCDVDNKEHLRCKNGPLFESLQWGLLGASGVLLVGTVIAFLIERPSGEDRDVETSVSVGVIPNANGGGEAALLLRF